MPAITGLHQPGATSLPAGTSPASTDAATSLPAAGTIPTIPGYVVLGEIARGGMGLVLAARDCTLDREVAVKVLLPEQASPAAMARFVAKSKITARLPHPGIPPVHQLGELSDGSPFLAMKLIRGRTLANLLANGERKSPGDLVVVFEQICQAVGFAHSVGIIHRDLKPLNVMVGAFGEVQVMDWGLAKETRNAERGTRSENQEPTESSAPHSAHSTQHSDRTQAGAILGTPAYMPPEQARGEPVDCRADVFALGGILCAILTGKPPYTGTTVHHVWQRASRADLGEAFARLNACKADPELIALATSCLQPNPELRPANGKAVADAVAAYRAGVEQRLRQVETERAAAEAKATEETNTRREAEARVAEQRKRRKVQFALFAALGLLIAAGGAFAWWQARTEGDRKAEQARVTAEREANAAQDRTRVTDLLALAVELRKQYRFPEAAHTLRQAAEIVPRVPDLSLTVERVTADLEFVRELDAIRMKRSTWIAESRQKGRFDRASAPLMYRKAFASRGLDVVATAEAVGDVVLASAVREELLAALDDWAILEPDATVRDRVLIAARRADPNSAATPFRELAVWRDKARLEKLVASLDATQLSPGSAVTIAEVMRVQKLDSVWILRSAVARHPRAFSPVFELGLALKDTEAAEALGAYRAARALRPDNYALLINLGNLLYARNEFQDAAATFQEASRHDPKAAGAYYNLGLALADQKNLPGAAAAFRKAIDCDPSDTSSHYNLGFVLSESGDKAGAIAALEEALRRGKTEAKVYVELGVVRNDLGDRKGAEAAYRTAIKIDPKFAPAHNNLGLLLEKHGDVRGAIAAYREAIRLEPADPRAPGNLWQLYHNLQDYDNAAAVLREALKHHGKSSAFHGNLAIALMGTGNYAAAVAPAREAVRLAPMAVDARINLGVALVETGDTTGAIAEWKEASRLDPKQPTPLHLIALAHYKQNRFPEAIAAARAVLKVDSKYAPAHAILGDSLRLTGDIPGARVALAEAARLDSKQFGHLLKQLPPEKK